MTTTLYTDLTNDPDATPVPIHLGFRLGRNGLIAFLHALQVIGVNHVVLNLKYGNRPVAEVLEEIGQGVSPMFAAHSTVDEAGYAREVYNRSIVLLVWPNCIREGRAKSGAPSIRTLKIIYSQNEMTI